LLLQQLLSVFQSKIFVLMFGILIYVASLAQIKIITLIAVILTTNNRSYPAYITSIIFKHINLRIGMISLRFIISMWIMWILGVLLIWDYWFDLWFFMNLFQLYIFAFLLVSALTESNWKILLLLYFLTHIGFR
jgi:hypothetical protein